MTGYSSSKWLPPSIIHVTACTGRTLVFLSRMRASDSAVGIVLRVACSKVKRRRGAAGYRVVGGLRKDGDDSEVVLGIAIRMAAVKN